MQSVVAAALVVVVVAAAAATTAEVTVMELTECQTYLLGILMLSF